MRDATVAAGMALAALLLAAAAPASPAAGDAAAGAAIAEAERCMECHGPTGLGDGPAASGGVHRFAKLAGQPRDYLALQLRRFRSGARKHDVMRLNAARLEEGDIDDVAAFFAAQPRPARDAAALPPSDDALAQVSRLYAQGDAARGIAACAGCHGEAGGGTGAPRVPLLAGQDPRYLAQQLENLRSGWRREPADGSIKAATRALEDREIRALAQWLAAAP